jgi:autotransporter passenger strand-loop-strand repeat protein
VASRSTIDASGREYVSNGGLASGATVGETGALIVLNGGVARAASIGTGGEVIVSSGGVASDTAVLADGAEHVSSGGTEIDPSIAAGGRVVDNGRILISGSKTELGVLSGSGTLILRGAADLVLKGASTTFSGESVISGGTLELAHAHAVAGAVLFAAASGSAVLQIDAADAPANGGVFANELINFNNAADGVDLRNRAFVSGATAVAAGGVLTVTDGGYTASFDLGGASATSYKVASDGHGGTLIETGAGALVLAHATAAFAPGPAASVAGGLSISSASTALCVAPAVHVSAGMN